MSAARSRVLRLGVAGLGRAFTLMWPAFRADPRIRLMAAADPREAVRSAFAREFAARTYSTVEALADDPDIDAIYIATPHQVHAEHVEIAARAGRHVLVEKPIAITLAECDRMIAAAEAAGVHLIVGHSHSFDRPIQRARELIASGAHGPLGMITALNFGDFLYRPRRPEELDTARGGGVIFSQAAHQVDIVRLLGGGLVETVRASTGNWDPARSTEGAYSAHLTFESGAFASLTYSGYGHFDTDEFCGGISELGAVKDVSRHGTARRALAGVTDAAREAALKAERGYGGASFMPAAAAVAHEHFGVVIASCRHADIRPLPDRVMIHADTEQTAEMLPPPVIPRVEVIDELHAAVVDGRRPPHDGRWARATLEVCLAILESSRTGREISLTRQTAVPA